MDDSVLLITEDGANLKSRVTPIAFTATGKIWVNNHAHILKFADIELQKIVEVYLNNIDLTNYITGQAQPKLNQVNLNSIRIPLPPKDIQAKIVSDIELLERQEQKAVEEIGNLKDRKFNFYKATNDNKKRLDEICELKAGQFIKAENINKIFNEKLFPCYGGNGLRGYTENILMRDYFH